MDFQENLEIDLIDLCKYILRRWRVLVCGIIIGTLIAGVAGYISLNKYYSAIRASQDTSADVPLVHETVVDPENINVELLNQTDVDDINRAIDLYNTYNRLLDSKSAYYRGSILFNLDTIQVPILNKQYLISDEQDNRFPEESESDIKNIIALYKNAVLSNSTIEKIKAMKRFGVNRVSIGVESTDDKILTLSTCGKESKYRIVLHSKKI